MWRQDCEIFPCTFFFSTKKILLAFPSSTFFHKIIQEENSAQNRVLSLEFQWEWKKRENFFCVPPHSFCAFLFDYFCIGMVVSDPPTTYYNNPVLALITWEKEGNKIYVCPPLSFDHSPWHNVRYLPQTGHHKGQPWAILNPKSHPPISFIK